ncbi:homoserine kinase [Pelagibaculum spongiae]|uniref:Homoserine kinase n=1 Tax=Pelagibaculum spongiae TaxID=2080658 RepID=A0A2V1GW78_9GAMM|nr:homoserine kinase [Pelagibaculum spongiae]PVZ70665.1 homoserine kinase [Pelagibaculum spongiae]
MSVYTTIDRDELQAFLDSYQVGQLVRYRGISAGVVNTNYFVTTDQGEFVLTIFEQTEAEELPYFLNLTNFLHAGGLRCGWPLKRADGSLFACFSEKHGKPAQLAVRLPGEVLEKTLFSHCRIIGAELAKMHLLCADYPDHRDNEMGHSWRMQAAGEMMSALPEKDQQLLKDELVFQQAIDWQSLPRGVVHGDLFRDNALFDGDELSGMLDFFFACDDVLVFDIAITALDWCRDSLTSFNRDKLEALLEGYQSQRSLSEAEKQALPAMQRAAALRFWLSRLTDVLNPRDGELTELKDPTQMRDLLLDARP